MNGTWRFPHNIPAPVLGIWAILKRRKTAFTQRAEGVYVFLFSKKKKKQKKLFFQSFFFFLEKPLFEFK